MKLMFLGSGHSTMLTIDQLMQIAMKTNPQNLQNYKFLDFFLTVKIELKLLQNMSGLTLICFQCHLIFTNDKKLYFERIRNFEKILTLDLLFL